MIAIMDVRSDAVWDGAVDLRIEAENGHRLMVRRSDGSTERCRVLFEACQNPACSCYDVKLVCTPMGESHLPNATSRVIPMNIESHGLSKDRTGMERADLAFARAVVDGMSADQWRQIRALFVAAKRKAMENTDLDALKIVFPPEVVFDGMMVAYDDIFPFAELLMLSADGRRWLADDQYCVQPGCKCREVVFSFFPLPPDSDSGIDERSSPAEPAITSVAAVRYDLTRRTMKVEALPAVEPSTAHELMTSLERSRPDFVDVVVERRRLLRELFRGYLARSVGRRARPVVASPKIGRNEPCPCGSGKKYQSCCGRFAT